MNPYELGGFRWLGHAFPEVAIALEELVQVVSLGDLIAVGLAGVDQKHRELDRSVRVMVEIHLTAYRCVSIVTIIKDYTPYSQGSMIGDIVFELARVLQEEKRREASLHRLADSLPRCHSWSIGRYRLTVAKAGEGSVHSSSLR